MLMNRDGLCLANCSLPFLQAHRRSGHTKAMRFTPMSKAWSMNCLMGLKGGLVIRLGVRACL